MKKSFIYKTFTLLLISMGGIAVVTPAQVEANDRYTANKQDVKSSVQYRCMERAGVPATVAYTSRGAIELIRWQNDYFNASSYTLISVARKLVPDFKNILRLITYDLFLLE